MHCFYQQSNVQGIIYAGEGECFFPDKHVLNSAAIRPPLSSHALSPPLVDPEITSVFRKAT